jgi:hypothetical protein
MRIIEFCPFFKENTVAEIHVGESSKWVDVIHITEVNRTFQYQPKAFFLNINNPKVRSHSIEVEGIFKGHAGLIPHVDLHAKSYPKVFRNPSWFNEAKQRELALAGEDISDEDIVILSDIDEIIDSRYAEQIVTEVKRRGAVTIKLHFTLFVLNLFSRNFGGPVDYSYRVTILKGSVFKNRWRKNSDWLRKSGERGLLYNEIFCFDDIMGFHHSWLGDEKFVSEKLSAYAHTEHAHLNNLDYIRDCIRQKKSIFPGHELEIRNDVQPLSFVRENLERYKSFFISE